jgi:C1A family cysteine protease
MSEQQTEVKKEHIKGYGWIPDLPDRRDLLYSVSEVKGKLPSSVDLRDKCPPAYDQGALGSCTANAIAAAIEFDRLKQGLDDFTPSRLFIYYNERDIEGTVSVDSGAMIRDGIKSVNIMGACSEKTWPYDLSKFTQRAPMPAYMEGAEHEAVSYERIPRDLFIMKSCLASGYPFVFGFTVYESFESQEVAQTGEVPLPDSEEKVLGGHAVVAVGYDDSTQRFIVRNSWSDGWGDKGYFTMPYEYLTNENLSDDMWQISIVT